MEVQRHLKYAGLLRGSLWCDFTSGLEIGPYLCCISTFLFYTNDNNTVEKYICKARFTVCTDVNGACGLTQKNSKKNTKTQEKSSKAIITCRVREELV